MLKIIKILAIGLYKVFLFLSSWLKNGLKYQKILPVLSGIWLKVYYKSTILLSQICWVWTLTLLDSLFLCLELVWCIYQKDLTTFKSYFSPIKEFVGEFWSCVKVGRNRIWESTFLLVNSRIWKLLLTIFGIYPSTLENLPSNSKRRRRKEWWVAKVLSSGTFFRAMKLKKHLKLFWTGSTPTEHKNRYQSWSRG